MAEVVDDGLSKFLAAYPSIDDPQFSYELAKRKEFYDLKMEPEEKVPDQPGDLLTQQLLLQRFFSPYTPYQTGLIDHGLGTGKCLLPDSLIHTNLGPFTIAQLYEKYSNNLTFYDDGEGLWSKPTEPIIVTAYDEVEQQFVATSIARFYRQSISEEVAHLAFSDGAHISITKAHHLYNGTDWTNKFTVGQTLCTVDREDDGELVLCPSTLDQLAYRQYKGWVYDLEIDKYHNFVANGVLCHNTCSASAVVEAFKTTEVDGRVRNPALVFVRSDTLERKFRSEVATICTKDVYSAKPTARELAAGTVEMTAQTAAIRLARSVEKSYDIVKFETFLKTLPSDETIKRKYSSRVIIIDEAHELRIQPKAAKEKAKAAKAKKSKAASKKTKSKKSKSKSKAAASTEEVDEDIEGEVEDDEDDEEANEELALAEEAEGVELSDSAKYLYNQMHRFLHVVENCRILLLTGTPIWDRTNEIAALMNLILPLGEQQLPTGREFDTTFFDDNGDLTPIGTERLRAAFRGRVSVLRPMMTTAKREEIGQIGPWTKFMKLFPDVMSEEQAAYVQQAREKIEIRQVRIKGKTTERKIKGGSVLRLPRDAANFVFPVFDASGSITDYEYGPEAFTKYAVRMVKRRRVVKGVEETSTAKTYSIENRFLREAIKNNLKDFSAKFASIIAEIKAHPKELVFVYIDRVEGAGAILFGLCMELHGFRWAKKSEDIGTKSDKKRFCVISANDFTTSGASQITALIDSFNKPDNMYGDRCQIIVGSEKTALGLSIHNIRQIHVLMPHWNMAGVDQPIGRGLRVGSHKALPSRERYVKIYRHTAVDPETDKAKDVKHGPSYPPDAMISGEETIDTYVYTLAENKEYRNSQIYRLMKETAFDCPLTYRRNVLKTDTDGTRECDYQTCNYECDGFPPTDTEGKVWEYDIPLDDLDHASYNLYHSSGRVKEIIDELATLFNHYFALRLDTVAQLLSIDDKERDLLLQAIDTIINSRMLIRNRYGFPSYLKEQGNFLFLDNTLTPIANYSEATYIETPLVTERSSFTTLVTLMELERDNKRVDTFCRATGKKDADKWEQLFAEMTYSARVLLFESVMEWKYKHSKLTPGQRQLYEVVTKHFAGAAKTMKDETIVHNLFNEEVQGPAYNVSAKAIKVTGLVRYYDKKLKRWAYVENEKQEIAYARQFRAKLEAGVKEAQKDNPYGLVGIIHKKDPQLRISMRQPDGTWLKGGACKTYSLEKLFGLVRNNLNYLPPAASSYKDKTRKQLIDLLQRLVQFTEFTTDEILADMSDQELRQLLTLLNMAKPRLCAMFLQWFQDHNLLVHTDGKKKGEE